MDERFLCRGKRLDNGEWVQGYIWINETLTHATTYYIADRDGDSHRIDPDTKGHCTGLRDKNGVLIFEGDVCKDRLDWIFKVTWDTENVRFIGRCNKLRGGTYNHYVYREPAVEVIGNIYDNKEILEGVK